ncbi:hypothetical protein [Paenibacillus sp.]|uniref:hypothetical protein n=1 Tax=Paenibacillus sp. TaxID=58172 RepID=UPI002D4DA8B2|nr:hypothetical protein [Paenibacillus sp.]HZG86379.1 hypothetical protein [Paenibacillus sp.]
MDCPICMGTGELEGEDGGFGLRLFAGAAEPAGDDRRGVPTALCFRCGGSGYLEQIDENG